jgi:hypothetical protein
MVARRKIPKTTKYRDVIEQGILQKGQKWG